jgi:hypothetical protein
MWDRYSQAFPTIWIASAFKGILFVLIFDNDLRKKEEIEIVMHL